MYCIKWKDGISPGVGYLKCLLFNINQGFWDINWREAKFFSSEEEAIKYIRKDDGKLFWDLKFIEFIFIHPFNVPK